MVSPGVAQRGENDVDVNEWMDEATYTTCWCTLGPAGGPCSCPSAAEDEDKALLLLLKEEEAVGAREVEQKRPSAGRRSRTFWPASAAAVTVASMLLV